MTLRNEVLAINSMLEAFIAGDDRSLSAAGRIEVALDDAFPDDDEVQDYVTMFASYRPEGGDYLYDAEQMVTKCRALLGLLRSRLS